MQLLDLPDELLQGILVHLPFAERLELAGVCRRLRALSAVPSELWGEVDVQLLNGDNGAHALEEVLSGFVEWLAPRAPGVRSLTVKCPWVHDSLMGFLPAMLLPSGSQAPAMPLLSDLAIQWGGRAVWSFRGAPATPALRTLWLSASRLSVPRPAADAPPMPSLPGLDLGFFHGRLSGGLDVPGWVPAGTTQLRLMDVGLERLPRVLPALAPTLRSLSLDRNGWLHSPSLSLLTPLTRLEALDLGENMLDRFPREVSALTRLRILFLHKLFPPDAQLRPSDWDALAPLRRLAFLSISSNHLRELPPVVAGMTQLQGLHIEDNQFRKPLPAHAPCWGRLVELLLDWGDALRGPGVLAAARRLTRLVLHNHLAMAWAPEGAPAVPPAELADALLAAAGAHSALRLLQDVVAPGQVSGITPPVARALLLLPRRLPAGVELGQLRDTYIGWRLDGMPPEVAAAVAAEEGEAVAALEGD